jgi:hypothetical protein
MPAALLFLAPPAVGFALGLLGRRWSIAIVSTIMACAVAASGWVFGWSSDSETPPLGGAILFLLFLLFLGVPFVGGVCLGTAWGRSRNARAR